MSDEHRIRYELIAHYHPDRTPGYRVSERIVVRGDTVLEQLAGHFRRIDIVGRTDGPITHLINDDGSLTVMAPAF